MRVLLEGEVAERYILASGQAPEGSEVGEGCICFLDRLNWMLREASRYSLSAMPSTSRVARAGCAVHGERARSLSRTATRRRRCGWHDPFTACLDEDRVGAFGSLREACNPTGSGVQILDGWEDGQSTRREANGPAESETSSSTSRDSTDIKGVRVMFDVGRGNALWRSESR